MSKSYKDYLGKTVYVGDTVIFVQKDYRAFMEGKVVKITAKTVLITHERTNVGKRETRQGHEQTILLPDSGTH